MEQPKPDAHHRLVLDALEDVVEGHCKRLMIFMPPGAAKTTMASVYLPAYYLGRHPGKNVIAISYAAELAESFGRRARRLVENRRWANVWGCQIDASQRAVDSWRVTNGSEYYAVGLTGAITGKRSDCCIIDDPLRGREDANSRVIREKTWGAYTADVRTRLKPGGAIVICQTRWHEDDLSGRILPEGYAGESGMITARDGEVWRVISLQAICERADDPLGRAIGEPLWPEYWEPGRLEQERVSQGAYNWNALFQQRPAPEEGNYFLREWIKYYDAPPAHLELYGASDYAVTADDGDYTVHMVIGVDPDDNVYVLDAWRKQAGPEAWVEQLVDMAKARSPLAWFEESGQIAKSVGPLIDRRQREVGAYFYRKQYASAADKPTRAQAIRGRMAQGKVYFPRSAPWLADLIHELMTFPNGRYDDQVDVLSLFGRALAEMIGGTIPRKLERQEPTINDMLDKMKARARRYA